jgi:leucyl-tRNA synthetase
LLFRRGGCVGIEMSRFELYGPKVDVRLVERLKSIEAKWRARWSSSRLFEADPDPSKPKFFVTFPYPYVNGYPHLGGAFTILRVDITARFKRMKGYNVLFAQGWHATGGPIVSAALRVREGDPKIISDLKLMGITGDEVGKFADPRNWVDFFSRGWKRDLIAYGMSIDWRREFYTTYLNPYYNKFIEWQYLKLREKGLVGIGEHPVVWCPKEGKVVGDHDRPDEYAGIGPVEATIMKFKSMEGYVIPTLTYRPETVFGVTNIWVHPEAVYNIAEVDGELWVVNNYILRELEDQGFKVGLKGEIRGVELLGKIVLNTVTGLKIPILPAWFVDPELGTGIVMSVPAHAPYDYIALAELQSRVELLERYGLDVGIVRDLKPIPLIKTPGYSITPAKDAVEARGIRSQVERDKLDDATKEVYSREYYEGVLLENTGVWAGRVVSEVKDAIVDWLVSMGIAVRIYTLPQRVYCRCGSRTHVRRVRDQWFLLYSKPEWKKLAFEALESMNVYPREAREEMRRVIERFRDWAFTHKGELGTRLPWDPEWVIESLSDSTIYMAYYTLAKYLQHPEEYGIKPDQLKEEFFDYVLLGLGDPVSVSKSTGIPVELVEAMRREFLYWYPVDLRISGKDLMYNHLAFYILHHVAIFPRELWPRGIAVNGYIMVAGEKMSKSKGNFILLREALEWWGADATRWAEVMAGADSTLEDPNFDPRVADSAVEELNRWIDFARENYGRGRDSWLKIDEWFESTLNQTVKRVSELMETTMYKSALVEGYYNLQSKFRWYLRRAGAPNRELLKKFIEIQTLLVAPIAPHVADEVWEGIGKEGYASISPWPSYDESKIKPELDMAEEVVRRLLDDAREVLRLVKQAQRVKITVAAEWKYDVAFKVREELSKGLTISDATRKVIRESKDRERVAQVVQAIMKNPEVLNTLIPRSLELEVLKESQDFLSRELGVTVEVDVEEESTSPRRHIALPGKPAIYAY